MTLELRVTSGARTGTRARFEKSVVTVGRHPMSDLQLHPVEDIDASTRHAELRAIEGVWTVHDRESTNGTFVNGERIAGSRAVHDGDVVTFGRKGPNVLVRTDVSAAGAADMLATNVSPTPVSSERVETRSHEIPAVTPLRRDASRKDTTVRIAEAVHAQTVSLKRWVAAGVAVVVAAGAIAALFWHQESSQQEREMRALLARNDSASAALRQRIEALGSRDSQSARVLEAGAAESRRTGQRLAQGIGGDSVALYSERLRQQTRQIQSLARMDLAGVHAKNDAAVALIASDLDGTFIAGTAFGVTSGGQMVTNRHVVRMESGQPAKRVRVLVANTTEWLPAHVVRMSESDDLALLQLDVPGTYPVVAGISRKGETAQVGAAVASIGYPHAVDTPMEGTGGLHVRAATTLTGGTVSKRLDDVIQIDSYAGKGSSGSPVFDARANVVGVIYGGAAESNGRIVYAVPAQRLSAFLSGTAEGLMR